MVKRKGQMFLVGALILCAAIAGAAISTKAVSMTTPNNFADDMFSNIENENRYVLNLIAKENVTSKNIEHRMIEYMSFIDHMALERNIKYTGYFIIALPINDDLNVTIINYNKALIDSADIIIDGTKKSVVFLPHKDSVTMTFDDVPDYMTFNYTVSYSDGISLITQTDEINMTRRLFSAVNIRFKSGDNIRQSLLFN
ncbi:MAG: hypothetical protein GQ477_01180 [Nanohaloarchaea archaeon]|nr:hypothetical protein [Candidatus Nanohaloarchaea archaeon]